MCQPVMLSDISQIYSSHIFHYKVATRDMLHIISKAVVKQKGHGFYVRRVGLEAPGTVATQSCCCSSVGSFIIMEQQPSCKQGTSGLSPPSVSLMCPQVHV